MTSIDQQIREQGNNAPIKAEMSEEDAYHLINNPDWQIGYLTRQIAQEFNH